MRRGWFFGLVVGLLVLWHGDTQGQLEKRSRALERAVALAERELETIERQTAALDRCAQALEETSPDS